MCLVAPYCKQTNKQFPSQILGLDWKLFPAFQRTAGGLWNLNGVTKALIQRESSSIMYLTPNCFWSLTKYLFFCWCCSNISKNQVTIKELKEEEQKGEIKTSKCCLSYIQNVIRLTKQPMLLHAAANPTPASMWFPEYMISISYVSGYKYGAQAAPLILPKWQNQQKPQCCLYYFYVYQIKSASKCL